MTNLRKRPYPQTSWCFLRTAPNLRGAIKFRLEALEKAGHKRQTIAKEAGVNNTRLSSYLNGMHKPMTQYQLIQLAKYLGITVDLKVGFEDYIYPHNDILKDLYERSK